MWLLFGKAVQTTVLSEFRFNCDSKQCTSFHTADKTMDKQTSPMRTKNVGNIILVNFRDTKDTHSCIPIITL
jgi:hypothetical protein